MKLIVVILFTCLMQVSASSLAQRITLSEKNVSIELLIKKIKQQTGYDVLYGDKVLNNNKKISIKLYNAPVSEALDMILEDQNLSYTVGDKTIVIKEKEPSLLDKLSTVISNIVRDLTVRGVVKDEKGFPLPNATIQIQGKSAVYKSNEKGEFEIKNVDENAVLTVTYVGYGAVIISLKDAKIPLEIKLNPKTGQLEEVNVSYSTGYQDIPKERATGSFVKIDNELFNRAVGTNVLERILNVTSGLRYDNTFVGNGNSATNITIRGRSTINANLDPLIVVDGFPYEEQSGDLTAGKNLNQNPLFNLNPNDVESITILRDAAAASIWGARSGNGVIVITTKKGKYNQPVNVSFNSNFNLTEKPRLNKMQVINPMDAIEFEKVQFAAGRFNAYDDVYPGFDYFSVPLSPAVEIMLAARKKNKAVPGYNATTDPEVLAQLAELGSYDVRDDVGKYLLQTSVNQQYAINLSGGTDKMKFYGSVGYDRNLPVERGNKDNRLTLNFNNAYRPIKKLELNTYLVYTKSKSINNGAGYAQYLPGSTVYTKVAPYTRLLDENGNALHVSRINNGYRTPYLDTASYPRLLDWHYRPLDELLNNDNVSNLYSARFGGGIKYELISGLNINISSQYEKSLSNTNNYQSLNNYNTRNLINQFMKAGPNGTVVYPIPLGGILDYSSAEQSSWNVRGQLNFNKSWNKHQLTALLGGEASERMVDTHNGRDYGYDPNTGLIFTNMDYNSQFPTRGTGGGTRQLNSNLFKSGILDRFTSYYANAGYTFKDKYTLTGSARFDASNFFGSKANQRVTPLWSSGLAWDITRETFYKVKWLSVLKLKVTYGYNANLNNKATALPTASYNLPSIYLRVPSLKLETPPNPGLTWEKNKMLNIGLDYAIFNQRISGSFEYYTRKGINLIGAINADPTIGFLNYTGNYASIASKGIDVVLNTVNVNGRLKWSSSVMLSYNTDKLTHYEFPEGATDYADIGGGRLILNKPLAKLYSYPSAGLDPANGNPRGYVDGEIKDFTEVIESAKQSDLIYHGSPIPKTFGSIINTFAYKNLSLSMNVTFRLNYYVRKKSMLYADLFNTWGNAHADYYLRWQKPGDELHTQVPSLPSFNDGRDAFYTNSDALVIKGDHIRLNDIRLSYNLSKAHFRQLPFTNASFYVYANNLGILWRANNDGIDPDNTNTALPPVQRSLALGLTLNF